MNCYNIGIIGGGVSGLSVLYQIVQQAKKDDNMGRQFTVHMFDALSSFGCGAAWSHNNTDVQLFNFPAGVASYVYRDFSGPFVRWCKTHNHEDVEYFSYPPRYLLGDYAEDFLKELISEIENSEAARGTDSVPAVRVVLHPSTQVHDMIVARASSEDLSPDLHITYSDESDSDVKTIVMNVAYLCTGPASTRSALYPHLHKRTGYISSPWPHPSYIPPSVCVGVIGTGLSAVDAVKQLMVGGHKGKVIMASRTGLLPTVKGRKADPFRPLTVATHAGIAKAVETSGWHSEGLLQIYLQMFHDEMLSFYKDYYNEVIATTNGGANGDKSDNINGGGDSVISLASYLDKFETSYARIMSYATVGKAIGADVDAEGVGITELRSGIARAEKGTRVPFQDCIIALTIQETVSTMWNSLSSGERESFQSVYMTLLQVYFNSMPEESARDMLKYCTYDEYNCKVKGGLCSIEVDDTIDADVDQTRDSASDDTGLGFRMNFKNGVSEKVDFVINASGFDKSFALIDDVVDGEENLHRKIVKSGLVRANVFGGLCCDFNTCRLVTSDDMALVYGTGHVVSGSKLITSGVGYCLSHSHAAVTNMFNILESKGV